MLQNVDAIEEDEGNEAASNRNIAEEEEEERRQRSEAADSDSDSDDDDDVTVTIGDIKAGSNFNITKQRGNLLAPGAAAGPEKPKAQGKFSIEEFESVGTISGQLAHEFSIDSLDDKPWRKPGADITDYFNYGFNEETWRAYCEKQKRMRLHESGVGLQSLAANQPNNSQAGSSHGEYMAMVFVALLTLQINANCSLTVPNRTLTSLTSGDNSKYPQSGPSNVTNAGPSKFFSIRIGTGAVPNRNGIYALFHFNPFYHFMSVFVLFFG